jgi:YVTN family beta-propeller protein
MRLLCSRARLPRLALGVLGALAVGLALLHLPGTGLVPTSAATASPKAYVGLFGDDAVAVLDTGTNRLLRTIPVPAGPHGIVVTPDGRKVYVSSDGASTVSVIDTATDQVTASIEVGPAPHGLAITPDGRQVLAAVFDASQVVMIDTANDQVVRQVGVPNPHNFAISPDGRTAYVAAQGQGATALAILDVPSLTPVGSVPLDKTPRALGFSPDGQQLYFTEAGLDAVAVLDPASRQLVAQIPVGASPHHPLFTPSGEYALVVSQGTDELAILTPGTNTVSATLAVGTLPHWIATDADGETAYVTNEGSNDISVVDLDSHQVMATIPVGNAPRKIVLQPGGQASRYRPLHTLSATTARGAGRPVAAVAPQTSVETRIAGMAFEPTITITPGQTITWTNTDAVPHTVTSADRLWDSGRLPRGESYSLTLDQPGTYAYGCSIHPFMRATVVVQG